MQNRGAILTFTILFFLVSIYQLSFTWKSYQVKTKAAEYAHGDLALERQYLDSISSEPVYNFLGLKDYTFRDVQEKELNLGLDLKGGMEVVMEISTVDVIRSLANYSKDTTFNRAIDLAKQMQRNSQSDFVTLFGQAFEQIDPNAKLAAIFSTLELKDQVNYNSTNDEVLKVIRTNTKSAIDNSFNILRSRIDRFGVTQPNIQRLEGSSGRVLIELPGIKEPERVRKLLQGTANLEFWETYDNREVYQYLLEANKRIKEINELKKPAKDTTTVSSDTAKTENTESNTLLTETTTLVDSSKASTDTSGGVKLLEEMESDTTASAADTARTKEQVAKDYPLFSVLSPNTTRDGNLVEGAAIGISHFKDTAKVDAYLSLPQVKAVFPRTMKLAWTVKPLKNAPDYYQLVALKVTTRDGQAPLGGDKVTNARAEFSNNKSNAEVTMTMNGEGAKTWARLTKDNVGKQIAIVLDGYVYSFPVVQGEIRGGRSSITGDFTIDEAKDLANVLKSGKLPAPARIIEEAVVGPSLGKEAINESLKSFLIAFILVLLYMVFYYSRAGVIANIALLSNMIFIVGVLASLGAVLTLPGMAGIVLTIGMSVDANVLIFERIREELRAGKGVKLAITDGYNAAYSSILDANVTTLLTGIILYVFGTGPIQGFATTLIIGILTSLFSAILITRLIYNWVLNRNGKISMGTKMTNNILVNAKFPFIEKRKIFYAISGTLVLISFISIFAVGFNLGIDFKGGRTYIVRFPETVSSVDVANDLKGVFGEAPEVKVFGSDNQLRIATKYMIDSEDKDADMQVEQKLFEGLKPILAKEGNITFQDFDVNYKMSSQKVGPTIADDIKVAAMWAVLFSLIIIFLYILIRFRNWQYSLGGVVALIHDTAIVLGVFSLFKSVLPFSLEIDQAFIAAILTVVGYSINDTVVIFDRIREFFKLHPKRDKTDLFNDAMNSTLSRTINTSLTTFIVLLIIFIFGGEVIRGFVFAIMIGIVVGTYSSLFIASPITFDTMRRKEKKLNK